MYGTLWQIDHVGINSITVMITKHNQDIHCMSTKVAKVTKRKDTVIHYTQECVSRHMVEYTVHKSIDSKA